MNERVLQLLQDTFVDRDFLAPYRELRLLALIAALIANQLREQSGQRGERQHEQFLGVLQQIVDEFADEQAILLGGAPQGGDFSSRARK